MCRLFQSAATARREHRRSLLLALLSLLLVSAAAGWWLHGTNGTEVDNRRRATGAQVPATPPGSYVQGAIAPNSADGGTQAPAVNPPGLDTQPARADDAALEDGAAQPRAFEPALLSDDTDLSHARRGGLHRAANPLLLTASAVVLADQKTGEVLDGRNDFAILPIASLTKLLTGIVVLESKLPLNARIRIAREDVDTLRHSRSRLPVGTTLTRSEALHLALMSSENRAANALARTSHGGTAAFVAAMNAKAQALGMQHSNFVDPTGLSNGNRATARDVATLVAAAARDPVLRSYSTTPHRVVEVGQRQLRYINSNRLVRAGWPIQLQKTGYIVEAGQCMAMALRSGGRELVMVLLDSGSRSTRQEDAERLRRWIDRAKG